MFRFTLSRGNSVEFQNEMDRIMMPMFGNYDGMDAFNYNNTFSKSMTIDVIAVLPSQENAILIPEVRTYYKEDGSVDLFDLVNSLKFMGYSIENTCISYYSSEKGMFVYCGKDPLPIDATIPLGEVSFVDGKYQIHIRFREDFSFQGTENLPAYENPPFFAQNDKVEMVNDSMMNDVLKMEFEETSTNPSHEDTMDTDGMFVNTEESKGKVKRTKERKIGEIMEKVLEWRRLYNGYEDKKTGKMVKVSLDVAASMVGMSKKSLDDYLLQIRFGKTYGFDFISNANERVGVLRAFVKKSKGSKAQIADDSSDIKMPYELAQLIEKKEGKNKPKKEEIPTKSFALSTRSKKISK